MKHTISAVLFSAAVASSGNAMETQTSQPHVAITWLGGPTMLIEFNDFRLITDPMFGAGEKAFLMGDPNEMFDLSKGPNIKYHQRLAPPPMTTQLDLDLILLSHAHEDHFDQLAEQTLDKALPIVTPTYDLAAIQGKGFTKASALEWQQSQTFVAGKGEIRLTAVPAHHSAKPDIDKLLGAGNGYQIQFSQGDWQKTLYWTGDTMPTEDLLQQLQKQEPVDLLIPHLGKVGTEGPLGQISMGAQDVMTLIDAVQPEKVLPIHHSSYALYQEPILPLVQLSLDHGVALDLISEGSTLVY